MDQKPQNQGGKVNVGCLKLPVILLDLPDNGSGGSSNEAQKGATVVNGPLLLEDDNRLGLPPGLKMFFSDVKESPHFLARKCDESDYLPELPRLTERRSSNRDLRRF